MSATWASDTYAELGGLTATADADLLQTNPAAAAAAASSSQPEQQQQQQTPEELYAAWLSRQYAVYIHALLQLLGSASASPSLQVSALAALMECVRHEAGPAAFSNRLFGRVISCMLTGSGVQPEVSLWPAAPAGQCGACCCRCWGCG